MLSFVSQSKPEYSPQQNINMMNKFTLTVFITVRPLAVQRYVNLFAFAHTCNCTWISTEVGTTDSCVCVHIVCKAASSFSHFLFSSKPEIFISIISLGVFNTNTLSSPHACAQICVYAHVLADVCASVCTLLCKRLPKETNKHISHCAHMVTREQNKIKKDRRDRKPGREGMQTDAQG